MRVTIEAGHGLVHVEADDRGVRIEASGMRLDTDWSGISGAGIAQPPGGGVTFDPEIESAVPLLGRLRETAQRVVDTHEILLIVHGPRRDAYQVSLPIADPGTVSVVATLRGRLGPRWLDGEHELGALKRQLRARTPGWQPIVGLVFVIAIAISFPFVLLAGGRIRDAFEELDPSLVEPWMPVAIVIWLGLVGALLWRVRRVRR